MVVYPAYTIDRIENELSHRQINELIKCWQDLQPICFINLKIRNILAGLAGVPAKDLQIKFGKTGLPTEEEMEYKILKSGFPVIKRKK